MPHYSTETSNVQTAKAMYENSLFESMLSKSTSTLFHYLRSITSSRGLPSELQLNETCAYSDYDKANLFNEYFNSVFTKDFCVLPDLNTIPCPPKYINNNEFSDPEVFEALTCLDPNKAMGIDMISPSIVLQPLFNLCAIFSH